MITKKWVTSIASQHSLLLCWRIGARSLTSTRIDRCSPLWNKTKRSKRVTLSRADNQVLYFFLAIALCNFTLCFKNSSFSFVQPSLLFLEVRIFPPFLSLSHVDAPYHRQQSDCHLSKWNTFRCLEVNKLIVLNIANISTVQWNEKILLHLRISLHWIGLGVE